MAHELLESVFEGLNIGPELFFRARQGFEDWHGSESHWFYVVTAGRVPGIYTHWEDASPQVNGYKNSVYKKHFGWSAATSAWDAARRPMSTLFVPCVAAPSTLPSTPRLSREVPNIKHVPLLKISSPRVPVSAPSTPTRSCKPVSTPSTPTNSTKKLLYVCSRGEDTTIYANQHQASSALRCGLSDNSFHKLEVTSSVRDVLRHTDESALEVREYHNYRISRIFAGIYSRMANILPRKADIREYSRIFVD
ncbi:hypothetical protein K438DRAFT_1996577 [Mycena galopus ATCC 62051]|nr:hypothetical protein K438DRAFT_1996577 [Mycena galopus ATCC 62051]